MQVGKGRPKKSKKIAKSGGVEGAKAEKSDKTKETRAGEQRKMGGQRSSNKEQEPSLAAHSEQLKTKNADRQMPKRAGGRGRGKRNTKKQQKGGGREED